MFRALFAAVFVALALAAGPGDVRAQDNQAPPTAAAPGRLHVDIDQGNLNPMPIAIVDFLSNAATGQRVGSDVAGVIRADLERSALFHSVEPGAFIEHIQAMEVPPRFADWKIISAQALVVGQVTPLPDGRIQIEFRLWDVFAEQSLTGFQYTTTPDNWRRIAHKIADRIYQQLTGERGYFDTRVVFVSETDEFVKSWTWKALEMV